MAQPRISQFEIQTGLQARQWEVVRRARQQGIPWNELVTAHGVRALHYAVQSQDTGEVRRLLQLEAPLTTYMLNGKPQSLLWTAIHLREDDIAEMLILAGAASDEADPRQLDQQPARRVLPLMGSSEQLMTQATLALLDREPALFLFSAEEQAQIFAKWAQGLASSSPEGARLVLDKLWTDGWQAPLDSPTWRGMSDQVSTWAVRMQPEDEERMEAWIARWREKQMVQRLSGANSPLRQRS